MPQTEGKGLSSISKLLVRPDENPKDTASFIKERWRITMALGLVLHPLIAIILLTVAAFVDWLVAPVALIQITGAWAIAFPVCWLVSWQVLRQPDLNPKGRVLVSFSSLAMAIGFSVGLIDQAVGSPVSVAVAIALLGCWLMYPERGFAAFIRPLVTGAFFAIGYLGSSNGAAHSSAFAIGLTVSILAGVLTGFFGGIVAHHAMEKNLQLHRTLENALTQATAAVKAKAEFLATMSHEIRTPLNGVIGMISLLGGTKMDEEQTEHLDTIQASGTALLRIINDILDFSKLEAGQMLLESAPFQLRALANELAQVTQANLNSKLVQVEVDIAPEVPAQILGDSTRLRQVLQNLLSNASKFTQQGSVTLKILSQPMPDEQVLLHFSVTDTGIGIPQAKQASLFQPFSQADSSTTREFGGTGLGLAICKEIVEHMGGKIQLRSQEGKGSTFHFSIPLSISDEVPADNTVAQAGRTRRITRNCHILLVEDHEVNRRLAGKILNRLGVHFEVANDGVEALQAFRPEKFDLILMDCSMPRMDGYQATQSIRKLEAGHAKTPIIALTANALAGDRQKALAVGMDDHLSKPYTLDDLEATLVKWLPDDNSLRLAS